LPPALIQELEKTTPEKKDRWHPNLVLTQVQKLALNKKNNNFLQKSAADNSEVTLSPAPGSTAIGGPKMNCECRFVKNPDLFGLQKDAKAIDNFVQTKDRTEAKMHKGKSCDQNVIVIAAVSEDLEDRALIQERDEPELFERRARSAGSTDGVLEDDQMEVMAQELARLKKQMALEEAALAQKETHQHQFAQVEEQDYYDPVDRNLNNLLRM
jgi:hypothetical protein